jgi:hypothetical protein
LETGRNPGQTDEAERLIVTLKNVTGVNVTRGPEGSIEEIHVFADGGRPPKSIVRDVKSALKAVLRVDVDYRKISVAMRKSADGEPEEAVVVVPIEDIEAEEDREGARPRFLSISLHVEDLRSTARVGLALGEREVVGEAAGATGRDAALRLVAAATLEALQSLLAEEVAFHLAGVEMLSIGGDEVVVVNVHCLSERTERTLIGGAAVTRDRNQAIVHATLGAVNRVLGRMKQKESVEFELRSTSG